VQSKARGEIPCRFPEARHLNSPAYDFSLAAFEIPSKSASVRFAVSLRNNQVGHYSPDRLLAWPAKDAYGAIIPISYGAVGLHNNDRIKRSF